jgi:glycosyltransferase involved in cell wall biosynthesis
MSYLPNNEAALWFYAQVWPLLIRARPDLRWLIIGKDPSAEVQALAGRSITVTGTVDDVRQWLEQSRLSVVPLLAGGGTRLKILEAMAMERVVVSTTLGAEGIEAGPGLLLADSPQAMAETILNCLQQPQLTDLGRANRRWVEQRYSWSVIGPQMVNLVEQVGRS